MKIVWMHEALERLFCNSTLPCLFPSPIVSPREDGVAVEHAGTGVAHHLSDLLPHGRFVAVDGARRTFRFVVAKGALFEAAGRVVAKLAALRAEAFLRSVAAAAEDLDHRFHGAAFGLNLCMGVGHGGIEGSTLKI